MTSQQIPQMRRVGSPRQGPRDALVTSFAASIDRSLMRAVSLVVERRLLPRDVDLDLLRDSIEGVFECRISEDPLYMFSFVRELQKAPRSISLNTSTLVRRISLGGRVYRRELVSTYQPLPELAADTGHKDNCIHFEHWVHTAGREKGTVVILHGFAMGWPSVDAKLMAAKQWYSKGMNVVLLTLPDHGPRRAPGSVISGQRFTVPHALRLAGAVQQATHEIFELKAWLREVSDQPVGLYGMSLGGYLASLCGGLSDDFDFLIPLVPPACFGDLAWRVYRETGHHSADADPVLTEGNMRAAFFAHSPLAHERVTAHEKILIIAGAGDRIVPPEHPTALWEHWGRPAIHWFRGSHIAPVAGRSIMSEVHDHLRGLDIL